MLELDYEEEKELITESFLEFEVSGKIFAIKTDEVIKIVPCGEITPVPEFPDYVKGVITADEKTVAVIDSAVRFKYPPCEKKSHRCVIIASAQSEENPQGSDSQRKIGITADNVIKIRKVPKEQICPPPEVNHEAFTRYITGMFIRTKGEPCFIVSPVLMMTEEEKLQLTQEL